ncbi:hypothetical protein KFK09_006159 [Dendrobium nobile]|uniref:Uncharacterized protein n=1 Tax=Dendrobium nobile TaxID=94219 RepID=A0A8T3BSU0_DENNO|nr:hypothetical protein KFK09_006159 [Dendrobium nobile]
MEEERVTNTDLILPDYNFSFCLEGKELEDVESPLGRGIAVAEERKWIIKVKNPDTNARENEAKA